MITLGICILIWIVLFLYYNKTIKNLPIEEDWICDIWIISLIFTAIWIIYILLSIIEIIPSMFNNICF